MIQIILSVLEKVGLAIQNGPVWWLLGLHSVLFSSRAQGTFGFSGGIRVVLCSCFQAKMGSQSVFASINASYNSGGRLQRALEALRPFLPPQHNLRRGEKVVLASDAMHQHLRQVL